MSRHRRTALGPSWPFHAEGAEHEAHGASSSQVLLQCRVRSARSQERVHPGFPEADTKHWIVPAGTICKDGDFKKGENTERAVTVCLCADQRHARYIFSLVPILLNAGI